MTTTPFMQLYWGDYFSKTRGLTCEQHGAYLLLLGCMWTAGGSLPNDPKKLGKMVGCTASRWARISADVLEFFEVDGDRITNPRLTLELEKAREKSNQRAIVGRRGGEAKALKNKEASLAKASVLPCHSSEPEPEEEREDANASLSPVATKPPNDDFDIAWKAYPHVKGRSAKPKAKAAWLRLSAAHRNGLPFAMARYAAEGREPNSECGAPAMERWLAKQQFLDWLEGANVIDFQPTNPTPDRRNWRDLEAENNRNALLGAKLLKDNLDGNGDIGQRGGSGRPDGPGLALPPPNPFAAGTGDLVAGLSRRFGRV